MEAFYLLKRICYVTVVAAKDLKWQSPGESICYLYGLS